VHARFAHITTLVINWIMARRTIVDGHNLWGASWILPTIPA
jgi:hypothetical protein